MPIGTLFAIEFTLIVVSVALAAWHAHLIRQQRPIVHWVWATIFGALVAFTTFYWHFGWRFAFMQLAGHLPAFNWSLNRFRGLSLTYVSKATTSTIDQLLGHWIVYIELLCAAIFLLYNVFIYVNAH